MKVPVLRTAQHLISPNARYSKFHEAVVDEKGNVVGVFFGPYAKLLAEYATSWTDVMKLAQAQVRAEDQKSDSVEDAKACPAVTSTQSDVSQSAVNG